MKIVNLIEEINFNNKWIFFLNNKVTNFTRTFLVNQFLSRNKRVYERLKESISFLKNYTFNFEENYCSN